MRKKIAVGSDDFPGLIRSGSYFVDKSVWIKPLFDADDSSTIQLITRPRRFGKSIFMDMLAAFLRIDPEHPGDDSYQRSLFAGLDILKEREFCSKFMGKVPVLSLTFKGIAGNSFEQAFSKLAFKLTEVARRFSFLQSSTRLDGQDLEDLRCLLDRRFMTDPKNVDYVSHFIALMSNMLEKHFGEPVVLLIDEYDVPLAKAASGGYYRDMLPFYKTLLDPLKKETGGLTFPFRKAVLTGCLRISKESIFTGLNNLAVNTVCTDDDAFSAAIGFTPQEVEALLTYYGLECRRGEVKAWYDGYRIASSEIYCPWDVLSFCAASLRKVDPLTFQPVKFWVDTSDNAVLDDFLGFIKGEDSDRLQALIDGGEICIKLNEQLTFADLKAHRSEDFWTLLLFTGYLTCVRGEDGMFRLRIPNEAVRDEFRERILKRFTAANDRFSLSGTEFAKAALTGDAGGMSDTLYNVLQSYVSVRDSATRARAENFYHGFLSALLVGAGDTIRDFRSNAEAGDGYADILFASPRAPMAGVVIEIKYAKTPGDLEGSAQKALKQIHEKRYVHGLKGLGCKRFYGYGVAFHGKSCVIEGAELKG